MKKNLYVFFPALTLILLTSCSAATIDQEMGSIAKIVHARNRDFYFEIFVIPENIATSSSVSAPQLEARYAFKVTMSGEFLDIPILALAEAIEKSSPRVSESAKGDFRWGILVSGMRSERVLSIAVDRRAKIMLFQAKKYEINSSLEEWFSKYIDPVMLRLVDQTKARR
jgi:hypothetical protein